MGLFSVPANPPRTLLGEEGTIPAKRDPGEFHANPLPEYSFITLHPLDRLGTGRSSPREQRFKFIRTGPRFLTRQRPGEGKGDQGHPEGDARGGEGREGSHERHYAPTGSKVSGGV
jgi:hypothetical protein